jgi:transposase
MCTVGRTGEPLARRLRKEIAGKERDGRKKKKRKGEEDKMNIKEITAGIDISQSKLDICIKNHGGVMATAVFSNDTVGASHLLELLVKHTCLDVAMESTGPYWYGIHDYLADHGIRVTLVNPAKAKAHLLNKSDKIDSDVLATLHMINQLKPSYVPDHEIRRLRRLVRFRAWLMDMKTAVKNQTTATVSKYSSSLMSVFSDAFGVSGKRFLKMLSEGKTEGELVTELDGLKITAERRSKITDAIANAFKPNLDPWVIQFSSEIISTIESRIKVLDDGIAKAVDSIPRIKEYVNRILTIKGVGLETAQAIAAEVADITRFECSGSLVRYAGISAPRMNCARDGGRPSGAALPGEAPNHRKLRRSKAGVVSVAGKGRLTAGQVRVRETNESEPTEDASKA